MSTLHPDDVALYLKSHPDFFEQYADILSQIVIAHPYDGGQVISLTERQMLTLREKTRQLEKKLTELLAFGEENDKSTAKLHRLAVGLNSVDSFKAIKAMLEFNLRDDFAIPFVNLHWWLSEDLEKNAAHTMTIQQIARQLKKPYCGTGAGFDTTACFDDSSSKIQSLALIALGDDGETLGLIAIGSDKKDRFHAQMGTLYLERIGELLSAALMRVCKVQVL